MQAAARILLLAVASLLFSASTAASQPGIKAVFIGHSFFRPFAAEMPFHATQAGIVGHTQNVVFRGGANGAPEALWNDPVTRAEIQGYLDAGDVELFGMTYIQDYPTLAGYINWFDYALAQNPDTRFMIALPWLGQPGSMTAAVYASTWLAAHAGPWHTNLIDALRALYPNVDIFCNPYGQSAVELRLLLDAGNLPGVTNVIGPAATSLHTDTRGHAGDILKDLGELVWLNVIYGVDLLTYSYTPPWATDLKAIGQAIMDAHNATYEEPDCEDGFDNDGDGLIDYPDDPDCWGGADLSEQPDCMDGIDNDSDGLIDFPSDPGCSHLTAVIEDPQCNDGLDNDGDGQIDYPADTYCLAAWWGWEHPECSDGLDNDGDGDVDYPSDPGCFEPTSRIENPQCNDTIDNDEDGQIDLADPHCPAEWDGNESCGLAAELALVLAPLMWLYRRRSRRL